MDYENNIYFKPWTRCGPYLVGLALGYILRRPEEFSLRSFPQVARVIFVLFGWCVSFVLLSATLYGLYGPSKNHTFLGRAASAIYNALARPAWGIGLAWPCLCLSPWIRRYVIRVLPGISLLSWFRMQRLFCERSSSACGLKFHQRDFFCMPEKY